MIVCVHEIPEGGDDLVYFVDTSLAVTTIQQAYVKKIDEAIRSTKSVFVQRECSLADEEGDEIQRMIVKLPQRVESHVTIRIKLQPTRK